MSSFSAAKVVPVCASASSDYDILHITEKKAMDQLSAISLSDLLVNPAVTGFSPASNPPEGRSKPVNPAFERKQTTLNEKSSITTTADQAAGAGILSRTAFQSAGDTNGDQERPYKEICSSGHGVSESADEDSERLWPKLDDCPLSSPSTPAHERPPKQSELHDLPCNKRSEIKLRDMRAPACLLRCQADPPPSPSGKTRQESHLAYETDKPDMSDRQSSPSDDNLVTKQTQMEVINEAADGDADDAGLKWRPKKLAMKELPAYHDKLSEMKENHRTSPKEMRLETVAEESESFARRELGGDMLNYMSTHSSANHAASSANHAANLSNHISHKHSHNHGNLYSYNHSTQQSYRIASSISAPAGTAVRTGSAFGLFRRGSSEGGKLGGRRPLTYRWSKPTRKPRSPWQKVFWPVLKIRDMYVGCMMGLEGAGDLSGMAQGGTYASRAQYFAEVPLSKTDSRNHG